MTSEQETVYQLIQNGKISPEIFSRFISSAVAEGIKQAGFVGCPLDPDEKREVQHFMGMIKDVGKGDTRKGVEIIRENSRTVQLIIKTRNRVGNIVLGILVTAATITGLALLGIKVYKE